jgi:1-acyl-sn-glycerol-3-phosphate acyltransferase
MIFIRSTTFLALFYLTTAAFAIFGLPCLALGRHGIQNLGRCSTRVSLWLLDKICGTQVEFRGLENLPHGACIIASKHQSTLETLALATKGSDFTFVVKRELFTIPILGWYFRNADQLPVDRSNRTGALTHLLRLARNAVAQGRQIIIFPEGTRRTVSSRAQYKIGVAHIYVETKTVCIPVALNTGLFWPPGGSAVRPGMATIAFLEPIAPGLDRRSFMRVLENRIETATAGLVAEALAADPSLKRSSLEYHDPANA